MNYDLHSVGFSTAGSILVLRMPPPTKDRAEGLYLQMVPGQDFMRLSVLRGDQPVEYDHVAGPASLVLKPKTGSGKVEFVFESPAILRVRTTGVALRLGDAVRARSWPGDVTAGRSGASATSCCPACQARSPWTPPGTESGPNT